MTGRVAVVTGGSSPIGAAIARSLSDAGAAVLVTGRDESRLAAVTQQIAAAGGTVSWIPAEASDPAAVHAIREYAEDRHGPVDVLVTAAGGGGRPSRLADLAPDQWHGTLERNLTTTYLTLREFVPPMAERGGGAVVAVSSDAARRISGASYAYAAAKAAALALMREVAAEVADRGVRVNAVAPGTVRTPVLDGVGDQTRAQLAATHPSGRLGTVDDVAAAVLFLLSDGAGWITGHTLDLGARTLT